MFHFLGFIFFFILIILLIGFVILWRIVNTFLGLGKRMTSGTNTNTQGQRRTSYQQTDYQQDGTSANNARNQSSSSSSNDKKKLFADDEGEYVEFEEIKE